MSRRDSQSRQGDDLLSIKMLDSYKYFSNNAHKIAQIYPYETASRNSGRTKKSEKVTNICFQASNGVSGAAS